MKKINSANPLHLIFEEVNGSKYFMLVPTNESKEIIKKFEKLRSKIRDLRRPITKQSDDYDKKYMKTKFDSDDDLPLNKTLDYKHGQNI